MNTYFIHDGRNEVGPFSLDLLKQQRLTRNTPIRQKDTDKWMPAEKLAELKPIVAPRKIKRPKDIVPAVREHAAYYRRTRPAAFYSALILLPLITGVSVYTVSKAGASAAPTAPQAVNTVTATPGKKEQIAVADSTTANAAASPVEATDPTKSARQRWSKLVTVSGSNYGIGFLGGIKDLTVTVNNRSGYAIDEAVAKVTYIKSSGEVWKSKLVTVKNIPARGTREQAVDDVGRGKKVRITLQKVVSKQMHLQYVEGQRIGDASDPYYKG